MTAVVEITEQDGRQPVACRGQPRGRCGRTATRLAARRPASSSPTRRTYRGRIRVRRADPRPVTPFPGPAYPSQLLPWPGSGRTAGSARPAGRPGNRLSRPARQRRPAASRGRRTGPGCGSVSRQLRTRPRSRSRACPGTDRPPGRQRVPDVGTRCRPSSRNIRAAGALQLLVGPRETTRTLVAASPVVQRGQPLPLPSSAARSAKREPGRSAARAAIIASASGSRPHKPDQLGHRVRLSDHPPVAQPPGQHLARVIHRQHIQAHQPGAFRGGQAGQAGPAGHHDHA